MRTRLHLLPGILAILSLAGCGGGSGGPGAQGGAGIDTSLGTSAGTGDGGPLFASRGGAQPDAFSSTAPPALAPAILVCTYLGGSGDQYLREVAIAADGTVSASGAGFSVAYTETAGTWTGVVSGDPATIDGGTFSGAERPPLGTTTFTDARHGLAYTAGYKQADGTLQQPFVRCPGGAAPWTFWDWSAGTARGESLTADSRCYDVWPMPDGDIGIKCWSDGGNTVLNRHPRAIAAANAADDGSWQNGANSMGTYYLRANPLNGKPISGTFLRGVHATYHAMDAWGRLYIPQTCTKAFPTVSPSNPFGHAAGAGSGIFVLDPALKGMLLNARLGGTPGAGLQVLRKVAVRGNILALVGTTAASDLACTANAVQSGAGGGQDGWLVIIRLWTLPII